MVRLLPTYSCYKFIPTNYDIITKFLERKNNGEINETYEIREENVYAFHPLKLNWNNVPGLYDYERYYFVKRKPIASDHKVEKRNANRVLETGEGYWRKSNSKAVASLYNEKQIVGVVAHLAFFYYKYELAKKRFNSVPTQFIMHEFTLSRDDNFQEWVVCRIKDLHREKNPMENILVAIPLPPKHVPQDHTNYYGSEGQPGERRQLFIQDHDDDDDDDNDVEFHGDGWTVDDD